MNQRALKAELAALEAATRPLEPDGAERRALGLRALDHALAYLDANEEARANHPGPHAFDSVPGFAESGRDVEEVMAQLAEEIDRPGFATTSPRFMAYIPGGGLFHSAIGDMLAAVSNKYAGFASASPGAVRLENACCAWLAEAIGFPATSAGTLTSGGSLANLTAIVTAREALDAEGGGAIYLTRFVHHCVDKGLHIAGRGRAPRRLVATDDQCRMDPKALAEAIASDRAVGIRPWLVVASAGTIDTGSVDPLAEIADICSSEGIWLHVDGAYGGLFALCEEGRQKLGGLERADSVALDPHKTLFLPYGTGAVLVRDGEKLSSAFSASAEYIRPLGETGVGPSPADLSPELTRHFRALRLWLPLQLAGVAAFRSAQREKLLLARYFHGALAEFPDFRVGPPPDLSVVAFRFEPDGMDGCMASERLLQILQQQGRVMLSGTRIDGRFHIRCAILSFRTHRAHVDQAIAAIRAAADEQSHG